MAKFSIESKHPHANGWVIIIDGMDMWSSYFPYWPDMPTSYLYEAIKQDWREKITKKLGIIYPFTWSRDINDTQEVIEKLYERIKSLNETGWPVYVLSHSWGTVLIYLALEKHPDIQVQKLLTLGSPISSVYPLIYGYTRAWLKKLDISSVSLPVNLKEWYNYYTMCDLVSGPISEIGKKHNFFNISLHLTNSACHSSYFNDKKKFDKILQDMINK